MKSMIVLLVLALAAGAAAQTSLGVVSIDGVTNNLNDTRLAAGSTHVVSIRYNSTAAAAGRWVGSNTFELYSPDGANWVNLLATDGPVVTALPPSTSRYRKYYTSSNDGATYTQTAMGGSTQPGGNTGAGCRVAYSLATLDFTGAGGYLGGTGGTNGVAVRLQFQSLMADDGKTICVDTTRGNGAVQWEWYNQALTDYPVWDNGLGENGPRCWAISESLPGFDWCEQRTTDNITFSYCQGGSYQLCACGVEGCAYMYNFAPGYESSPGSLDHSSGIWSWSGPTVPQSGLFDIGFRACDFFGCTQTDFVLHVTVNAGNCDCCLGRAGDVNMSGDDEPTIADVSTLIDCLFISGAALPCIEEADVNQSGGATPFIEDITIGDVSSLIDYLFITGPESGVLPECL